ncbi:MAG TPA: hypothetical protein VF060_32155 [Trebonia sp.]
MSGGAVSLAIAAAVCAALGSALQHQAAIAAGGDRGGIGLLWRLARSRRRMTGLAAAGAACCCSRLPRFTAFFDGEGGDDQWLPGQPAASPAGKGLGPRKLALAAR